MRFAKDGQIIQNFGVQVLSITGCMCYRQAIGAEIPLENQPRLLQASINTHCEQRMRQTISTPIRSSVSSDAFI